MSTPATSLLVPLDGSKEAERAIAPAARLARRTGAPLCLFTWVFEERDAASTQEYLAELASGLDVATTIEVSLSDDLTGSVVAAALERSATLCMATHGRHGLGRAVLGSVAEEIVGRLHEPAVLVGPHAGAAPEADPGRILVGVDGSDLAAAVVPVALAWAGQLGAPLELVQVVDPGLDTAAEISGRDVVESGYLERLVHQTGPERVAGFDVLHGAPAHAIVDHAGDDTELIAVGTHGRSGVARVVLGSVAMAVAHEARCPVLVVPTAPSP